MSIVLGINIALFSVLIGLLVIAVINEDEELFGGTAIVTAILGFVMLLIVGTLVTVEKRVYIANDVTITKGDNNVMIETERRDHIIDDTKLYKEVDECATVRYIEKIAMWGNESDYEIQVINDNNEIIFEK